MNSNTVGIRSSVSSGFRKLTDGLRATYRSFEGLGCCDQACFLTLPLLLLYADDFWYVRIPVLGLALAGLLFANVRRNPYFWFAITCFLSAGVCYNWWEVDNHKYLMCYWCLAIFFSLWHPGEGNTLATSARCLLALTFTLSFVWKLLPADFANGNFFIYSFLFDSRFSDKLQLVGLVTSDVLELNDLAQRSLVSYDSQLEAVDVIYDSRLRSLALGLVWWTWTIEGLLAVCLWIPTRFRLSTLRDGLLLVFVVSTYPVAPVIGFGWLLVAMGFVQAEQHRKKVRLLYLIVLLLLQGFRLPWSSIAASVSQ